MTSLVTDVMPIYDFMVNGELPQRDFNPLAYGHFVAHRVHEIMRVQKMNDDIYNDDAVFTHSTLESGEDFYIKDRWKRQYHFKIASFPIPPGILTEALQVRPDNSSGYRFSILSEWDADIEVAEEKLKKIIKKKINKKHLKRHHGQWEIEQYKTVEGRIETIDDPSRSEFDRVFIIDGHEITIEDFVKMLECYEGWSIQFKIVDSCDENNLNPPAD